MGAGLWDIHLASHISLRQSLLLQHMYLFSVALMQEEPYKILNDECICSALRYDIILFWRWSRLLAYYLDLMGGL
jgi:hypothetical protein